MASDWEEVNLGDLFEQSNQGVNTTTEKVEYSDDGLIVIRAKNISAYSIDYQDVVHVSEETFDKLKSAVKPKCGDILFTNIGSQLGSAALVKNNSNFIIAWNVFRIVPNLCKVNAKFLESFLNSEETGNLVRGLNASSTMPFISGKVLRGIKLNLPPLPEQKAIAHILGSLDDKIELNRQMNETLEAMAQALFKSWFVDFDPVIDNALAAGNAIPDAFAKRAEQRKGIEKKDHSDTQNLFPDEFEFTDEMGWIPKGWSVGVVEDVVKRLKSKKSYNKKDVLEHGEVPVYEQGAKILLGYHNNEPDIEAQINEPAFIFGDHTCVNKLSLEPFSISSNVIPLIGKLYPTLWVYYAVKDKQSFEEYRRHWMEFIIKSVILPSLKVTELFSENIKSFQVKQMKMQHQNSDLAKLRDTLLPKLMSGELRIPDAEALVDEAV